MNKLRKQNVILIGFMGCGKTTIGKILARDMGYQFVDTDAMIVEKEGMSISEIFASKGEGYFRSLETKVLMELNETKEHTIISTGGGLPIREENVELLQQLGCVIFLKIRKKTVLERLKGDSSRPLLQGDQVEEKVQKLLQLRMPKYEKAAHWTVTVDGKAITLIVKKVKNCYFTSRNPKKRKILQ